MFVVIILIVPFKPPKNLINRVIASLSVFCSSMAIRSLIDLLGGFRKLFVVFSSLFILTGCNLNTNQKYNIEAANINAKLGLAYLPDLRTFLI